MGNRPLPAAKAARYVKLIAEAIHYAHQQGILHRDLKPSNVLVDASDQPRITDFGLAKRFGVPPSGGQVGGPAEESKLMGHGREVKAVAFAPDGQTLATGGKDSMVMLWSTAPKRAEVVITNVHLRPTFSPDNKLLATASLFFFPLRKLLPRSPTSCVSRFLSIYP